MRNIRFAAAILLALLLASCGNPVPADKSAYVGEWHAKDMDLAITQDGRVQYERRRGTAKTSITAGIKGFEGNNFVVGFGPFGTTFVVTKPPYQDGNAWKMVVDGVELVKGNVKEEWKT
jgi:hypothetical protein